MRKRGRVKMIKDHDFYCTQCGNKGIPICRTSTKNRESGHLKYIYCLTCKEVTNHVECVVGKKYSYKDFLDEFELGNFDENGKRKASISEFRMLRLEQQCVEQAYENEDWFEIFGVCS